jgi:nucleotide-binding universal stress UspA family protein
LYNKILVPIDGSEHSKHALKEAIKIAKMAKSTITLLNVYPKTSPKTSTQKQPNTETLQKNGKNILTEAQKLIETQDIPVETLLLEGDVVNQIIKAAKENHFDLIIVGARGLSKIEEIMLGSISQGVTENAPCPVIVTR